MSQIKITHISQEVLNLESQFLQADDIQALQEIAAQAKRIAHACEYMKTSLEYRSKAITALQKNKTPQAEA